VKIGYARISTQGQNLDLQLKALKKADCRKIFREKVSGFDRQRPEFQRMLDQLRPGKDDRTQSPNPERQKGRQGERTKGRKDACKKER